MDLSVLGRHEHAIGCEDDVTIVRRQVKELALARGFDAFAAAAITTATSELTRNTLVHGGGGSAVIEELTDGARIGIRVSFRDAGPGIPDIARVLQGGYSTRRSLGLGLSGAKRLVDDFEIDSLPGTGTTATIVKWTRY
jgi:serine/threonine-protein kinase RsbT